MPCLSCVVSNRSQPHASCLMNSLGGEDFPAGDDLSERDSLVVLPLADNLLALDEDGEALAGALVEDLGGGCVSSRHIGGCVCLWV